MNFIKKFIIVLMIIQVILFGLGVYCLIEGEISNGIFLTTINLVCFFINIYNLEQVE